MKVTVTTTITTYIDIDTFDVDHQVDVATDDPLPKNLVMAAATGGCKAALLALEKDSPSLTTTTKE